MNFERILRYILLGGIFLVPFIPFIVANNMFFPFITGKNFAFRILTEILFGSWIILAFKNPAYRPTRSFILISIASFVGIIALADFFGANPAKSFWSNFERMEGLVTLIHLLAYFLIVGTVLRTQQLWTWFFNTSVAASVFMGIYGLVQLSGEAVIHQGGVRLDGSFGNATYLAVYMLFHIFLTAILLFKWRGNSSVRYIYGAIIVLQAVILYNTATRGAILGLLGGLLISAILLVLLEKKRPIVRKIGAGVLLALLLTVGGFFAIKDTEFARQSQVLSRFSSLSLESLREQTRFTIWSMAWQGVKERPILGWGQENFNLVFNTYYDPSLYNDEPWFDRVHNIVFDWLIAGGVVGLLAYLSIFLSVLWYLWFSKSEHLSVVDKSLFTGLLAAYSFHNLFVFDNLFSYILFFSVLAYIYALTRPAQQEESRWSRQFDSGTISRIIAPFALIIVVSSVYFFNTKAISASTTLIDALRQQPGVSQNLTFQRALDFNSLGDQEIREQLIQIAARMASNPDIDLPIKQETFNLAQAEMEKQIALAPEDTRHVLFMATLLGNYRQYEAAVPYLERALELSPNKQAIRFALGTNLLNRGAQEEALALLKETVALEPRFNEAHITYAIIALYSGNNTLADEILLAQFGTHIVDYEQLVRAYADSGRHNDVLEIMESRVEKNPNDFQNHISLAAAYLQLELRAETITALEKAIELNPSFKDQGEFLIQEVKAGRNP